ncbi:MAG: hypothetical protein JEY91_13205 [Spirochaetaceae bacterium]|nr:hypothetical protein [Spirochaetaceae bacterium]
MVNRFKGIATDKYRRELDEILDELIEYKPSLLSHIGVPGLFNWRAVFDFSSEAWNNFSSEARISIIKALAENKTLFITLMTYKSMYLKMNRPDIAHAAGLSLGRFLEDIIIPDYFTDFNHSHMTSVTDNYF